VIGPSSVLRKTGLRHTGRDVRSEEGGSIFSAEDGQCWVCSRSMIEHASHACRSCRAGKPEDWRAPAPAVSEVAPTLELAERVVGVDLGRVCECGCGARVYGWRDTKRYASVACRERAQAERKEGERMQDKVYNRKFKCVCGREVRGAAPFALHKRRCPAALAAEGKSAPPAPSNGGGRASRPKAPAAPEEASASDDRPDRELEALTTCSRHLAALPPSIRGATLAYLRARFEPSLGLD
jgi:hypothetical protein